MPIRLSDLPPAARKLVEGQIPPKKQRKSAQQSEHLFVNTNEGPVRLASAGEVAFYEWCRRLALPLPLIHPVHYYEGGKHEFDFLFSRARLYVEIQGGAGTAHMAHTSRKGMARDFRNWAEAIIAGYVVLPLTSGQAHDGSGALLIARILQAQGVPQSTNRKVE